MSACRSWRPTAGICRGRTAHRRCRQLHRIDGHQPVLDGHGHWRVLTPSTGRPVIAVARPLLVLTTPLSALLLGRRCDGQIRRVDDCSRRRAASARRRGRVYCAVVAIAPSPGSSAARTTSSAQGPSVPNAGLSGRVAEAMAQRTPRTSDPGVRIRPRCRRISRT